MMVGVDADHDQHDLRKLVDAESDKQDRQQRERDDFVEEENEAQEERADNRKHRHVQAQQHGRKQAAPR